MARQRIGELDSRIELQKEERTDDGMGGSTSEWVTQATVWAQVRSLTGTERMRSDMLAAKGGYRVVIHNNGVAHDVTSAWRIKWRGRTLNIRHIEDNGPRPLYLIMEAEAGVAT